MQRPILTALLLTLLALAPAAAPREAGAISAFSRQYEAECATCHTAYPRRNEFGEAFRKNGYVWPGREATVGEDLSEALSLSGLMKQVPLSVSLLTTVDYDGDREDDKIDPATDLQLHLGGSVGDRVGYFAHDLTGSAEAFALFRHVLGTPVNVKFGKIVPQTTLWKPNQTVTNTPLAPQGLVVAGEPALGTPREGLELNAVFGPRFFLAAGAVDRPNQDRMEYYGHAAVKIGGTDFRGREPDVDFDEESVWDFLAVTAGAYGYLGHTKLTGNDFYRLGLELEAIYKGLTLLVAGLTARDDDADGTGLEVDSAVALAEADFVLSSRWLLAARYEREDVGNAAGGIVNRGIGAVNWTPVQNVLLRVEGVWDRAAEREDPTRLTASLLATLHL